MSEGFLLINKRGGYTLLFDKPLSRYYGAFFFDKNMFKTIHHFDHNSNVKKTVNNLWSTERVFENSIIEKFFMPDGYDALIYQLNKKSSFELFLDCKHSYDTRSWGRNYVLSEESGCLIVEFSKKNDFRENSLDKSEYNFYLAIYSDNFVFSKKDLWQEFNYDVDKKRNSQPYSRWIYNAGSLECQEIVVAFSKKKKDAIKTVKSVFKNRNKLIRQKQDYISELLNRKISANKNINKAYLCAINSIDSLTVKNEGLFAGLPWFFQFWVRDESVSCKALLSINKLDLLKKILFRHLSRIDNDGRIENFYNGHLYTADVGWVFFRLEELLDKHLLHKKEVELIKQKIKFCVRKDLVYSKKNETWMDTDYNDNGREGYRIEIQALNLVMLRFYKKLFNKDIENDFKLKVMQNFFKDGILLDGVDDKTIRPNIFIVAYVYPELLKKEQWICCFDKILSKLWLDWGGLSSIDKNHVLFSDEHTGEDNKSYHRGDSWFWINNLAALVLCRLDKNKYKKYIDKIIKASTYEILYSGATGHHAELSSAKDLRSEGCFAQAWSTAMFIELVEEVYRR